MRPPPEARLPLLLSRLCAQGQALSCSRAPAMGPLRAAESLFYCCSPSSLPKGTSYHCLGLPSSCQGLHHRCRGLHYRCQGPPLPLTTRLHPSAPSFGPPVAAPTAYQRHMCSSPDSHPPLLPLLSRTPLHSLTSPPCVGVCRQVLGHSGGDQEAASHRRRYVSLQPPAVDLWCACGRPAVPVCRGRPVCLR